MTWEEATQVLGCGMPPVPRGTLDDVRARLEAWKTDVMEPAFKVAMREAHPDRGGDVERAKQVNHARDVLRGLHVDPPRPAQPQHGDVVIIINGGGFGFAESFTNTATTTGWGPSRFRR